MTTLAENNNEQTLDFDNVLEHINAETGLGFVRYTPPKEFFQKKDDRTLVDMFFDKIFPFLVELKDSGVNKCSLFHDGNGEVHLCSDYKELETSDTELLRHDIIGRIFPIIRSDSRMTLKNLVIFEKVTRYGQMYHVLKWEKLTLEDAVELFDKLITPHLVECTKSSKTLSIRFKQLRLFIKSDTYDSFARDDTYSLLEYHLLRNVLNNINLDSRLGVKNVRVSEGHTKTFTKYFVLNWS